ncbi:thioesterase family protein [Paenibacillus sp.]|uniref:acyl-CoA thioesterase n=1 Tax=Paenibacillus sp. TaxID=58172 RepID=UPI002D364479|nr:thioesterase family protein [Paenibacillus sp.]HZG83583.1 thioesterase family protein [Paenibacillus sp.]
MEAPQTGTWHSITLRVRYQETDQMGVVYHGNYVTWLEIARTDWTRAHGFPYRDIEERGLLLPVVDVSVQYHSPARYDDEVEVRCKVAEVGPVRLRFEYEVRLAQESDRLLATGSSRHVWVDREWKPVRLPKVAPDVYEKLRAAAAQGGE